MHHSRLSPRLRTGIASGSLSPKKKERKRQDRSNKGRKECIAGGRGLNEWNPIFESRRMLNLQQWNQSYVSQFLGLYDDESLVRTFMMDRNEPEVCQPQADIVDGFCGNNGLEDCPENHLVMMLDDRSCNAKDGRSRPYLGALTPHGALKELGKPRFRTPSSTIGETSCSIRGTEDQEDADAERRLIFVTDLDRWTIHALAATASLHQENALRAAIVKHLGSEPLIGFECSTEGLSTFQLSFHLPFSSWRKFPKNQPPKDNRSFCSTGRPLRRIRDLSFLSSSTSEFSDYLCEAQISCVISGPDKWRWVAYGFVDVYFEQEGKETVTQYHEDTLGEDGSRRDPLSLGTLEADKPIRNPREYFLIILRKRLGQLRSEWQRVVEKLKEVVPACEEEYWRLTLLPGPKLKDHVHSIEVETHLDRVTQAGNRLRQLRVLTSELAYNLSNTYNAWQDFEPKNISIFKEFSGLKSTSHQSLPAIRDIFSELKSLKDVLEALSTRCNDLANNLGTQEASQYSNFQYSLAQQGLVISHLHGELAKKNNELAQKSSELAMKSNEFSQKNNELSIRSSEIALKSNDLALSNKRVSWFMILFVTPMVLSAGIFSMQGISIPFLPPTMSSFWKLVSFFTAISVCVILIQEYGRKLLPRCVSAKLERDIV